MDDERLEWALRRLPGVLACSLEGDTVTLLLDPHASAIDVEAAANALLLDAGDSRPPLVLGGTRPVLPTGRRGFDVVPVVKAAGPGLVAVGAAALVAALVASPAAFWREAPNVPAPEGTGLAIDAPPALGGRAAGRAGVEAPAEAAPTRSLVLLVPELPAAPGLDASPPIVASARDDGGTITVQLAAASLPGGAGVLVASAKAPAFTAPASAPVPPSGSAASAGVKHKERAAKPRKAERRDDGRSDHEGERRNRGRAKASSRGGDDKDGCEG